MKPPKQLIVVRAAITSDDITDCPWTSAPEQVVIEAKVFRRNTCHLVIRGRFPSLKLSIISFDPHKRRKYLSHHASSF